MDFDQIVGDTKYWLRVTASPKLSHKNFAGKFGMLRHNDEIHTNPNQFISGYELRSAVGNRCLYGALRVLCFTPDGNTEITELAWHDNIMAVRSPLVGNENIHLIQDLPGIVLERVHDQLAIPLRQVVKNCS